MVEIKIVRGFAKLPSIKELYRKTYASIVSSELGIDDPDELQLFLAPDKVYKNPGGGTKIPRDWRNYSEGIRSPKRRNVKVAEIFFPGTEKWAKMIFWEALTGDFSHDSDFDKILSEMPGSEIHRILMDNNPTNNMFYVSLKNLPLKISKLRLLEASDQLDGLILLILKAEMESHFLCKKLIMNEFRETIMTQSVISNSNFSFLRMYLLLKSRFCYKWTEDDFVNNNILTNFKDVKSTFYYERLLRLFLLNFAEKFDLVRTRDQKIKLIKQFGLIDKETRAFYSRLFANSEREQNFELCTFFISFFVDLFGLEVVSYIVDEIKKG
ncbi:hypothetical protein [Marinicella meishanensis]|uniref:hypothetical protein n=1 Tax=Marinicella meishanensis TaxID=2873263 RepID=UPI001CBE2C2E|nr:hypothetical protein [Marinicella sp. NBU2979]